MSQSDFQIDNVSRSLYRTENNEALQALASLSSGATEPATMYAYQWWADTTSGILKMRNAANNAWINKGSLSLADNGYIPAAGGTFTGDVIMSGASIYEAEGAAVTSAATTDIWGGGDGNTVHVTGSTGPITSFGTAPQAGTWMKVIFDSTPTLTQGANLNLNAGGSDITIEAGDMALVYADTTTQLDVFVIRKSGQPLISASFASAAEYLAGTDTTKALNSFIARQNNIALAAAQVTTSGTAFDFTGIPSWAKKVIVDLADISLSGTDDLLIQLGDAGGIETTGYVSSGGISASTGTGVSSSTSGFIIRSQSAASVISGVYYFHKVSGNLWVGSYSGKRDTTTIAVASGTKTLSDTLTQLRVTRDGVNTFDLGLTTVSWE